MPEPSPSQPIAIVIPWFGRDQRGGAERHAWELASRLRARGHDVEVITTCCRSHQDDWETNHLPPGFSREPEGFAIRRFPVVARNRPAFDEVNARLMGIPKPALLRGASPLRPDEESVFADELIRSPALLEHLWHNGGDYRAFLFIPYLYFTTLRGLPMVADRSILVPCLHHESYAFLSVVSRAFRSSRAILFNSEGERRLASWLYGPAIAAKGTVAGEGIDFDPSIQSDGSVDVGALAPFVLCLGRQDPGKNTDFLCRVYARFRARNPTSRLRLVLAGPGTLPMPDDATGIVNLGPVSEPAKHELLSSCEALFNPSVNESYSRVIMEAWLCGRPVAVHRDCLATALAVQEGKTGWAAGDEGEWIRVLERVDHATQGELARLGEAGRLEAAGAASWDLAIRRYEAAIADLSPPGEQAPPAALGAVHQALPNLAPGDAISNEALAIRRSLRKAGFSSEIYALHVHPDLEGEAIRWQPGCLERDSAVLYHHSIGNALTAEICNHPGPKALIYHNITPHELLADYLPYNSALCREARTQLPGLARFFPVSASASIYNAVELSECSFPNPGVLPLRVDPSKWNIPADPEIMRRLGDGRTNILFVGRLSPNKRQEELIVAFAHYLSLDPGSRLHLVGTAAGPNDLYEACLRQLARDLGIEDSVNFTGLVDEAQLAAYYSTASLFWSMSLHEGFCVPLIEAMWFEVPVLAFASSAVPETLGGAGCLFSTKDDTAALAQRAYELVHDRGVREPVLERQRSRREDFLPERAEGPLWDLLARLGQRRDPGGAAPEHAPEIEGVREIAVVKLDHIGDVVLASPVFFSLARRFPGALITAVVSPAAGAVLEENPYVNRIIRYDPPWFWRELGNGEEMRERLARNARATEKLASIPFDLVVNLRSDHANVLFSSSLPHRYLLSYTNDSPYAFLISHPVTRTRSMHATQQHRDLLRSIGADFWHDPRVHYSDENLARATAIGQPGKRTVVLALGAGIPLKCWAPVKFRELARRLRERGYPVSIIGAASDSALSSEWSESYGCADLCGKLNLRELAAYLSRVGCLVANDSAPMHIGAASGIPVVYIMRPPVRDEFEPVGPGHVACSVAHCPNPCKGFDPNDRSGMPEFCACIQSITVDQVERGVLGVMATVDSSAGKGEPLGLDTAVQINHR